MYDVTIDERAILVVNDDGHLGTFIAIWTHAVYAVGEISGSRGGEYEDNCLLASCAMLSGRNCSTFQRSFLPPSSLVTLTM
jgi:hypothetical protein